MSEDRLVSVTESEGRRLELYDTGSHPEVFVDGIQGLMIGKGVVKWNFFSTTYNADYTEKDHEYREIAARIVCTPDTFLSLVDFLNEVAEQMKPNDQVPSDHSDTESD